MTCPTMRAIVVAHARPFVIPGRVAAGASVVVEKPSHRSPRPKTQSSIQNSNRIALRAQAIKAARNKFEISLIAQNLELLTDFLFDVSVVWIELTQFTF